MTKQPFTTTDKIIFALLGLGILACTAGIGYLSTTERVKAAIALHDYCNQPEHDEGLCYGLQ